MLPPLLSTSRKRRTRYSPTVSGPYSGTTVKIAKKTPAGNPSMVQRYVQEQAIAMLAMVADAGEATFGKVRRRF